MTLICGFCGTIFPYQVLQDEEEECPECHVGILVDIEEYEENPDDRGIDQ